MLRPHTPAVSLSVLILTRSRPLDRRPLGRVHKKYDCFAVYAFPHVLPRDSAMTVRVRSLQFICYTSLLAKRGRLKINDYKSGGASSFRKFLFETAALFVQQSPLSSLETCADRDTVPVIGILFPRATRFICVATKRNEGSGTRHSCLLIMHSINMRIIIV